MYVTGPAVGQASQPKSTNSTGSNASTLDQTFAQLLVAQLKSQDPLNPMDPTQFVSQLVGLNTLDAVSSIYQLLKGFTSALPGAKSAPAIPGGGN